MGKHSKPKRRSPAAAIIAVIVIIAAVLILLSNLPRVSDSLKDIPGLETVISFLDFTKAENTVVPDSPQSASPTTVRLTFDADRSDAGAPVYLINPGVAPNRLEFTLYNVRQPDMQAILSFFTQLDCVEDAYTTIVMDDSIRRFTVELSEDITWQASEYADGYFDFTVTSSAYGSNDLLYIVRTESSSMDEDMAALAEEYADFSPSIVKTQEGEYCLVAGTCVDEEEAEELLDMLSDDFYIEECEVFSNPE